MFLRYTESPPIRTLDSPCYISGDDSFALTGFFPPPIRSRSTISIIDDDDDLVELRNSISRILGILIEETMKNGGSRNPDETAEGTEIDEVEMKWGKHGKACLVEY